MHLSVDIDALDPWFAPSTGTPVIGGLILSELMYIGNCVHETGIEIRNSYKVFLNNIKSFLNTKEK